MARWVMMTSGTGLWSERVITGVMLDEAGNAAASLAKDLGQLGEDAGPVGDREPEIIARLDVIGGQASGTGGAPASGTSVDHPRGRPGPAGDDVDQISDDGRGGRHGAGASAVEEGISDGISDDSDGVIRASDFGQRTLAFDQRWGHAELEPRRGELGHGQEFDGVAQFAGVLQIGEVQRVDALAWNGIWPHVGLERQLCQDGQFVGGVGAVNIHGGVGLGIAELLGPAQGLFVRGGPRWSSG